MADPGSAITLMREGSTDRGKQERSEHPRTSIAVKAGMDPRSSGSFCRRERDTSSFSSVWLAVMPGGSSGPKLSCRCTSQRSVIR